MGDNDKIMVFLRVALLLLFITVSSLDGCGGGKKGKDDNCSTDKPCFDYQGDCDKNSECYSENCGNSNCDTAQGYLSDDDCCDKNDFCSRFKKCAEGQGDCNFDNECSKNQGLK